MCDETSMQSTLWTLSVSIRVHYIHICTVYSADSFTDFEAQNFKFAPAWGWGILLTQTWFLWLTIKGEKEFNLAIHRLQLSLHYTLLEEQLQCIYGMIEGMHVEE